jgi:hypothetical protein
MAAAGTGQDDRPGIRVLSEMSPGGIQRLAHLAVMRVASIRPVECHQGNLATFLK